MHSPRIAFFGTPDIAVFVLDELEEGGVLPSLIITNPDAPRGRKMVLTQSPVSEWAERRSIPTLKPETLTDQSFQSTLKEAGCELFVVAAYGKIIPEEVLKIPMLKTYNVHPSLLPKLRGASPIRSAILEDINPTGVTIMQLTTQLDAGPIVAQESVQIEEKEWPLRGGKLDELLARRGGKLLLSVLPKIIDGSAVHTEQNHTEATYTKKITKEMGVIDLTDDPYKNLLKIRAFDGWPGTYFFHEKDGSKIRVKIVDAELASDGSLNITRVIPEGKKEMNYRDL